MAVLSAQQNESKASFNTDYIVDDLIEFFGNDWKEIRKKIKKRNVYICEKYCTELKSVVSIFHEFPEHHMEK